MSSIEDNVVTATIPVNSANVTPVGKVICSDDMFRNWTVKLNLGELKADLVQ